VGGGQMVRQNSEREEASIAYATPVGLTLAVAGGWLRARGGAIPTALPVAQPTAMDLSAEGWGSVNRLVTPPQRMTGERDTNFPACERS